MSDFATVDNYIIGRELGRGAFGIVKLVTDSQTGEQFAMKLMKSEGSADSIARFHEFVNTEVAILRQINHPNVIRVVKENHNATYIKKQGRGQYPVMYILMELATNGDLITIMFQTGELEATLARYYFQQIISGLEAVHGSGNAHRDLKPDNILLDDRYNLKISDFGWAKMCVGQGALHTEAGTKEYMAPEILKGQPYDGTQVDLFAAGIILFILISKNPPFQQAHAQDALFGLLGKNPGTFWQYQAKFNPNVVANYTEEFKSLVGGLLAANPAERFTLAQVKAHPWFNGPVINEGDLLDEMAARRAHIEQEQAAQRAAQAAEISARFGGSGSRGGRQFRSDLAEESAKSERTLKSFQAGVNCYTQFFSTNTADQVWSALNDYIQDINENQEAEADSEPSDTDYKIKIMVNRDYSSEYTVRLADAGSGIVAVTFQRNAGTTFNFMKEFETAMANLADLANSGPPAA